MEFQFLFGNPQKKKKTKKGGTMAKVKRVRSRSTVKPKKANPKRRTRRKNPEKIMFTKAKGGARSMKIRPEGDGTAFATDKEFDALKKAVSAREKKMKAIERAFASLKKGNVGSRKLNADLKEVHTAMKTSTDMTPAKWNSLLSKEAKIIDKMKTHKSKVGKHLNDRRRDIKEMQTKLAAQENAMSESIKNRKMEIKLAKKQGFRVSGKIPVAPEALKALKKRAKKAEAELAKEEKLINNLLKGRKASDQRKGASRGGFTASKRRAKAKVAKGRTIKAGELKKRVKKTITIGQAKKLTKTAAKKALNDSTVRFTTSKAKSWAKYVAGERKTKPNPLVGGTLMANATKKKAKKKVAKKKVTKKKAKKKVVKKKTSKKKATKKKVTKKKTTKKKVTKKKAASRSKKPAKKRGKKSFSTLANVKKKISKAFSAKGGLGKGKKKSIRIKKGKKKGVITMKRYKRNPVPTDYKSAMQGGAKGLTEFYMQADLQELMGFAIGGMGHGLTNDIAVKVVGDMLGQRALLGRIASMPMGDAVFPLLGIGLIGHGLLNEVLCKRMGVLSPELCSKIIKGWAAATVVGSGIKAYDMVAPSIFAHRQSAMSGVDYTPMSGVDYTPMSGVDYTPMGSDFYGEMNGVDYTPMGGISVVDQGMESETAADFGMEESPADFGMEESPADFGMEDDMGSDFY